MHYVDLHVHSNASDGTLSPEAVIDHCLTIPLKAIALTDHDTVAGILPALIHAQHSDLEVIPGIELSCIYHDIEIHILGLYIDYQQADLLTALKEIRISRDHRNQKMVENFQKQGIDITFADLSENNPTTVITRAHFAKVLVSKGYATTMSQAFKKYLSANGKFYEPKKELTCTDAMNLLTSAKAFPVLAHPLQYHLGYQQIEDLITYLLPLGLRGLEVYHSSNTQHESGKLKNIATRCHLLPTGGSDFHGSNKPDIQLGFGRGNLRISKLLLDDIKIAFKNSNSN